MSDKTELHYRYNMFYLISFCLIVIVALLTVKWGSIANLAELISFGLTITSLFLSLIAIVFGIVSNDTFSKNTTSLQDASYKISRMTDKLQKITLGMEEKITRIPAMIDSLGKDFGARHQELIEKIAVAQSHTATEESPIIKKDSLISFLNKSSYLGLLTLLTMKLAKDKKKPFKIEEIRALNSSKDYSLGYIVASTSIGLTKYILKDDVFNVTKVDSNLNDLIESETEARVETLYKDSPELEDEKLKLKELKEFFA